VDIVANLKNGASQIYRQMYGTHFWCTRVSLEKCVNMCENKKTYMFESTNIATALGNDCRSAKTHFAGYQHPVVICVIFTELIVLRGIDSRGRLTCTTTTTTIYIYIYIEFNNSNNNHSNNASNSNSNSNTNNNNKQQTSNTKQQTTNNK